MVNAIGFRHSARNHRTWLVMTLIDMVPAAACRPGARASARFNVEITADSQHNELGRYSDVEAGHVLSIFSLQFPQMSTLLVHARPLKQ
jgi:hypothetical protein